jgi:hypothetical protein
MNKFGVEFQDAVSRTDFETRFEYLVSGSVSKKRFRTSF